MTQFLVLSIAYLLGSFPTALLVSRRLAGADIRRLGDANMGARNITHTFGFKYGLLVACIDIAKGAMAVLAARTLGLGLGWQIAAACAAILGHDFPLFAGFKGGQGLATLTGTLLALAPLETLGGFLVYGLLYAAVRSSNIAAAAGMGLQVLGMVLFKEPWPVILFAVAANLFIPVKKLIDSPRRNQIRQA